MSFFWIMYIVNLIIPVLSMIFGLCFYNLKLTKINKYLGYNIQRLYNDKEKFNETNKLLGKIIIILASIMLFITAVVTLPFMNLDDNVFFYIAMAVMILEFFEIISPMIIVEFKLKKEQTK